MPSDQPILVTGAAGFIGYHVAERLLAEGERVVGIDNLSDYYDVGLKRSRLARLAALSNFEFIEADISDRVAVPALFARLRPASCVHLAAQAGVRYSLEHPHAYLDANLAGTLNILEGCRHNPVSHLVYASSSSVYGSNAVLPFSVRQGVDHPLSLYAATKKANEMMAHSTVSPRRGSDSSRCMDRGDDPIWPCLSSPRPSWKGVRFSSSTMARCFETSPTSTTSSRVS
jgi:UDP-glucuronate 4-epimerase